ncbi:MAG: nucleotide exchange factor GrpE [Dehalococcoidia bacterium]
MLSRLKLAIAILLGTEPGPSPAAPPVRVADEPIAVTGAEAAETHEGLVQALLACLDLLEPDEDAAEQATGALAAAGVVPRDPTGARFDPARHRAQGRIPTDDPALDWVVASTVAAGWADGERVLRPAEVWVYRLESADEAAEPS